MRHVMFFLISLFLVAGIGNAEDWPQWLGTDRDSVWDEEGIVQHFPDGGLEVKWRVPVAWGYAGPAVANGKVYLMDYVHASGKVTNNAGSRDKLSGKERVLCFQADTGDLVWKYEYDRPYRLSYPRGPRCTPTVWEGEVYALGAEGNLNCLAADTGKVLWSKDLPSLYNTETPIWGYAGHPLVDGNLVFCVVGGTGTLVVAFDKDSGEEAWRSMSGNPSYCPPTLFQLNGKKQMLVWDSKRLNSLNPDTGKVTWSVPLPPGFGVATAAPRPVGDNLFATAAGDISALINAATGKVVWKGTPKTSMGCSLSTPIVVGETIYGIDGGAGTLIAANAHDGTRLWETVKPIAVANARRGPRNGTAFLVQNRDRHFLFNDSGDLILASLSAEGYREISRLHVLEATNYTGSRKVVWSHPAFAQKCLFARNDEELVCVSLASE